MNQFESEALRLALEPFHCILYSFRGSSTPVDVLEFLTESGDDCLFGLVRLCRDSHYDASMNVISSGTDFYVSLLRGCTIDTASACGRQCWRWFWVPMRRL
jgi:hypothetical protein